MVNLAREDQTSRQSDNYINIFMLNFDQNQSKMACHDFNI